MSKCYTARGSDFGIGGLTKVKARVISLFYSLKVPLELK